MLENPLRRSVKNSSSGAADTGRPDSPVTGPQHAGLSFAERKALQPRSPNTVLVEGNNVMRSIDRALPGDAVGRRNSQLHPEANRKKSAYFESEFAGPNRADDPIQNRIFNEAMVTAEIKTNVIISDEFAFITDLAYQLSNRYQRPISSVTITLQHGMCMLFGGTFEPAYTMAIHALPSLLQPVTNRRNAALIQRHLYETLGVALTRGHIRFEPISKENVAIGGKTTAAEIESLSRSDADQKSSMFRKPSKSSRGIMKSVKSLGSFKAHSVIDISENMPTPPSSNSGETARIETIPEVPPTPPADEGDSLVVEQKVRKSASRRKSLRFALFGNKNSQEK
ncbi:putative mif domain-containing protein [Rosellinia necatrix]|uniref:L-dopachrome isomerase n=1 Tax=Rosellinia necatrix TaxID=77044 RepID=A0A1W2TNQ3_ROSNE|nr:putative mif domain-containing protein [Rosellinia necatrix]